MADTKNQIGWAAKLAVVLVSLITTAVLAGALGEAAVRYRERHRATVPGTMPLLFYQHRRMEHALVRDTDYFGWVRVNRFGFRGREVSLEKPDGVFRIMAVGSSTTFDPAAARDERTWPARLEALLGQSPAGPRVEVINAGVPGYVMLDNVIRLQTELYEFRPDVIILYEGHNDMIRALRRGSGIDRRRAGPVERRPEEIPVVTPWGRWLSRHSLLYAKVVERWKAMRFAALGRAAQRATAPPSGGDTLGRGGPPPGAYDAAASRFAHQLTAFLALARNLGIPVVVPELAHVSGAGALSVPDARVRGTWQHAVPFAPPEAVMRVYAMYDSVARAAAARYGAAYVPTRDFELTGPEWYAEGDPIHFSDRGSERMARMMAQALLGAGLLEPGGRAAAPPPSAPR